MARVKRSKRGPRKLPPKADLRKAWGNGQSIGRTGLTKREVIKSNRAGADRKRDFLTNLPRRHRYAEQTLTIVSMLQRNGVFVPKITKIDYDNRIIIVEHGGKTLRALLDRSKSTNPNSRQQISRKLNKIFRMVGKVNALGVRQGHPHQDNIVLRGNRVGLIDFRSASEVPNHIWDLSTRIVLYFQDDYRHLDKGVIAPSVETMFGPNQNAKVDYLRRKLFKALVNQYPCSPELKKGVLDIILKKAEKDWK